MDDLLFNSGYLHDVLEVQAARLIDEVKQAPEDHLLKVDAGEWAAALAERFRVDAAELAPDSDWYQDDPVPVQVDVSSDHFSRGIMDLSTPTYVESSPA